MTGVCPITTQETWLTPPLAEVCFQSAQWGVSEPRNGVQWNVRLWNLWAANLKPFLVAHSCMAFTACCKCLSMASIQGPPTKTDGQVINKESSEDVPGYKRGQLINLQAKTCHGQDTTNWDTFLWVEFVRECSPWDILTPKQAVCPWGQSCEGLGWSHIARLSHRPFPNQRIDQLPAASVQKHPGDIFQDSQGGRQCYDVSWSHTCFCLNIPDFSRYQMKWV